MFADESGRLWSANHTGEAVVFSCISDGRMSGRALAIERSSLDTDIGDETLRAWLKAAPTIGLLS